MFLFLLIFFQAIELDGPDVDRTIIKASNAKKNYSSVIFETKGLELKVGLLNQAAPSNGFFFYNYYFYIKYKIKMF